MAATTHHFRAQAIPTIFVVLLVPVFCGLGIWQLDRAEQKRSTSASLEMRRTLAMLPVDDQLPDPHQLEFRKLFARGSFLNEKTVLIENRKHLGKTGFHVIAPLVTNTGQVVLVNRGWIPRAEQGGQPIFPKPAGSLHIEGEVRFPQPPALELDLNIDPAQVLPRWPFLTLEHYSAWSGLQVLPFVILQAAEDSSEFVRRWPQPRVNDAMHTGYAVQWFAFALIALVIWLGLSLKKQDNAGRDER